MVPVEKFSVTTSLLATNLFDQRDRFGRFQIERAAKLVVVHRVKASASIWPRLVIGKGRRDALERALSQLDQNDFGPKPGQPTRREGQQDNLAKIENPYAGQRVLARLRLFELTAYDTLRNGHWKLLDDTCFVQPGQIGRSKPKFSRVNRDVVLTSAWRGALFLTEQS